MKIGIVSAKDLGGGFWLIRYTDPQTGKDVRKKIFASKGGIGNVCSFITTKVLQSGGYLPEDVRAPAIREGFDEGLKHTKAGDDQRKRRETGRDHFIDWLTEHYPKVRTWRDLRANHLWEYQHWLEAAGWEPDTVRMRLEPIRFTWKRLAAIYPEAIRPVPDMITPKAKSHRPQLGALPAQDALMLLEWLYEHAPHLFPVALLQAMAGLRMLEAAYLRKQDVDLKAGLIHIVDTPRHTLKNAASRRTLPLPKPVLDMLQIWMEQQKKSKYDELFLNTREKPWSRYALSHSLTRQKRHAAATPETIKREGTGYKLTIHPHGLGMPQFSKVYARRLRATFNDTARRAGVPSELIDAYMGHEPTTVLGRHYSQHMHDEFRAVALAVERAWQNPGILDMGLFSECCKQRAK